MYLDAILVYDSLLIDRRLVVASGNVLTKFCYKQNRLIRFPDSTRSTEEYDHSVDCTHTLNSIIALGTEQTSSC